jgi:UDP-glucuronate 4-epimerase
MSNGMKILVTGGAGFIGSAVARRLADDWHAVVVIDNFNEYYDVGLKRARQQAMLGGIRVVEGDITDRPTLDQLFTDHAFEAVAHIAGQAGVRYSVTHPEVYVHNNILGTQSLLETMRLHGVKQFVFASTSSVYGTSTPVPFTEESPADRPVSTYAATKRAGELLAHTYHSLYGIQVSCLRFFTVYGPWSRPDMAMLSFAEKIQAGEPIDIYNNGNHRRDFTYIDDIVEGFVLALQKSFDFEIFNLGNGKPTALLDFVTVLERELGVEAKKNLRPMQPGDVYETYADISKAKDMLGYAPKTDFETGVRMFVEWFKTR